MAEETTAAPFVARRGERDPIWSLGGHFTTKLDGNNTDGRFSLTEAVAFRTTEPPLHIHHREDEAWYVIDGQMTFFIGDKELVATAGSLVFGPKGVAHTFTVDTEPTRVLVLASPAGFEHFAADLGIPALTEEMPEDLVLPTPEVLGPVAERYGIALVGPPIRVARGEV